MNAQLQYTSEAQVVSAIKEKEVKTGRIGHHFIISENGIMRAVSLSIDASGMLIANGRQIIDMNSIQVVSVQSSH